MIRNRHLCAIAIGTLSLLGGSAVAQPTRAGIAGTPLPAERVPASVAALAKKMSEKPSNAMATVFLTPASNLYGIAVERENHVQVFYTDREAKTLFVGMMFDVALKNDVGSKFIATHMPGRVDLAAAMRGSDSQKNPSESIGPSDKDATSDDMRTVAQADGFTTAASASPGSKIIYALIDPNCGYCADAWVGMSSMKNAKLNGYRIRWVPMTIGGEDGQVATMLGDEGSRFAATSTAMSGVRRGVPVEPLTGDTSQSLIRAKANRAIMTKLNITATPTFFVETKPGQFVRREGFSSVDALLAAAPVTAAGGAK